MRMCTFWILCAEGFEVHTSPKHASFSGGDYTCRAPVLISFSGTKFIPGGLWIVYDVFVGIKNYGEVDGC